jgi:hypothetical protein
LRRGEETARLRCQSVCGPQQEFKQLSKIPIYFNIIYIIKRRNSIQPLVKSWKQMANMLDKMASISSGKTGKNASSGFAKSTFEGLVGL